MFYVIYFYGNIVPGLLKYLVVGYDEKEQSLVLSSFKYSHVLCENLNEFRQFFA